MKTIPFSQHPSDMVPDISKIEEILANDPNFRPFNQLTEDSLKLGDVLYIFDTKTLRSRIATYIGPGIYPGTLAFTNANTVYSDDAEDGFGCSFYRINSADLKYFKVLFNLPIIDNQTQFDNLFDIIEKAGGFPLEDALPEQLPKGALVVLIHKPTKHMRTAICRILSTENKRFLYFEPSFYNRGWDPNWERRLAEFIVLPV